MITSFCIIRCYAKSDDESYKLNASSWEIHPMSKLDNWMQLRSNKILKETKDVFILKDIPFRTNDPEELDVVGIWLTRNKFAQDRHQLYIEAEEEYDAKIKSYGTESDHVNNNEAFHEYIDRVKEIDEEINQEFTEFLNNFEKLEFDESVQEG